ncbi:MAG: ATP-dependent DNA helicase RecG [Verrucomicrobiales bacterium]|nr:ATP-dependent DNA helicase RecG [Verrucomicrobiales bacterium]
MPLLIPDLTLDALLAELPGSGLDKKSRGGIEALGLNTVADLVGHFPRRYEDRTRFVQFPNQPMDESVCLRGIVTDAQKRFIRGRKGGFFEATIEPPGGDILGNRIVLRWFNMPFMHKSITVGHDLVIYGKPKLSGKRLVMDHPDYEILDRGSELSEAHMDRIVPVYPLASGISQKNLRGLIYRVLESLTDDIFPDQIAGEPNAEFTRAQAIREVHFPKDFERLETARRILALEEFVLLQLELLRRRRLIDAAGGKVHCGPGVLMDEYLAALPFEPTDAQLRTIGEVRADLNSTRPMTRMLQGDVGAGKTLVAAGAILLAVEAGFDAALMAPTQILAEQHFLNFREWLEPLGVTVKLKTGAKKTGGDADMPLFDLMNPDADSRFGTVTIGTHALIHGSADQFPNGLGLVVIDEQHKFGVAQRAALTAQGDSPDVLVMTATPIPRTLTLAFYGDLDVSILDELPKGRQAIVTGIRDTTKIKEATKFVREHLERGRQAYIVYSLIEESEKVKSAAATKEFDAWVKRMEGFECALLHGKMSPEEKETVMADFRDGKTDVLVSTTVIEVGVDVANANLMLIFNAERFGLAQLHQLRGRIGRGEHKSYCILMCDPENPEGRERLKILEETRDGFRIAEEDLRQRGPGEVLGSQQSGLPEMKFVEFLGDTLLVQQSREIAESMLDS